jgi:hypothetical protein
MDGEPGTVPAGFVIGDTRRRCSIPTCRPSPLLVRQRPLR